MKKLFLSVLFIILAASIQAQTSSVEKAQADNYFDQGIEYFKQGDYNKAETSILKARDLIAKTFGKTNLDYSDTVDGLGRVTFMAGNYSKSETYFLEEKLILEKILGKIHPAYANVLNYLGLIYYYKGDYTKAELYDLEAMNIREETLGTSDPAYAQSLNNLGLLYQTTGQLAKAEVYHLEAKDIREATVGKNHHLYALSLNNLGAFYRASGDLSKSETYYLEALNIYENIYGKENYNYAIPLSNLGELYSALGDYKKAETSFLEAKRIWEKAFGKEHPYYITAVNNLGLVYDHLSRLSSREGRQTEAIGYVSKAVDSFLEVKSTYERLYGKIHRSYADVLNNLGGLNDGYGDYEKAEEYYLEAKDIYEKLFGKKHPDYAVASNNLSVLYWNTDNYNKAISYQLEAKDIYEKNYGKTSPDYIRSVGSLRTFYLAMKNYTQAIAFNDEYCKLTIDMINRNFSFLSEQQRNIYWKTQLDHLEISYSLAWFNPTPTLSETNYNNLLFSKGLLLRTTNDVRDAVYSSGNASLKSDFEKLQAIREQISYLQQKEDAEQTLIKSLETEADKIDKSLTKQSAVFWDLQADMTLQWQDIQKNLKADEAAIEFISFRLVDKRWTGKIMYAALVMRPKLKSPVWVSLFDETQLQDILTRANGRSSEQQTRILYDVFGEQLYTTVWKPLEESLKNAKTVYYSPSGLLHKISFNALPTENSKRLTDVFNLILVSSTREVVHIKKDNASKALPNRHIQDGYCGKLYAYHKAVC